jgi:hypothetical protein
MVYRVRKNAALLFYLRLYGILLKHFLMNETGYQETGYLMGVDPLWICLVEQAPRTAVIHRQGIFLLLPGRPS